MKNFTKLFFAAIVLLMSISFTAKSQTNVSGGIFANTTWTLANSPYIVTDTVVVFPGVTLTIEPGVTVKFADGMLLELRQAPLIANGTITDSITFTSNSVSPSPGIYSGVAIISGSQTSEFNYCNFHYGNVGLADNGSTDTLIVRNSNFTYNTVGLSPTYGFGRIDSCNISNNVNQGINKLGGSVLNVCTISHNQTGIFSPGGTVQNCIIEYNQVGVYGAHISLLSSKINHNQSGVISIDNRVAINNCIVDSNTVEGINLGDGNDSIINSEIKYNNGTGLEIGGLSSLVTMCDIENNITGIIEHGTTDSIYCNRICNNTTYDLKYIGANNTNCVVNNYWCTADSTTIRSHIFDGYVNVSYGLVSFMPIDTTQCYLNVGIPDIENYSFAVFPNPAHNYLTIDLGRNTSKAEVKIFKVLGAQEYNYSLSGEKNKIDISKLTTGIYFLEAITGDKISRQKFVKE